MFFKTKKDDAESSKVVARLTALEEENRKLKAIIGSPDGLGEERAAQVRENLRAEQWRTLIKNAPAMLFFINANGVFTMIEGAGLRAVGIDPSQLLGQSASSLCGEDTPVAAALRTAFGGEMASSLAGIGEALFDVIYTPFRDKSGKLLGVIGVGVNITDRLI